MTEVETTNQATEAVDTTATGMTTPLKKKLSIELDIEVTSDDKSEKLSTVSSSPSKDAQGPNLLEEEAKCAKQEEKEEEEPEPEVEQVFQGKFMREDASWWSIFTFNYPKPLLDQAMKG